MSKAKKRSSLSPIKYGFIFRETMKIIKNVDRLKEPCDKTIVHLKYDDDFGVFDTVTKKIALNKHILKSKKGTVKTLIHEITHMAIDRLGYVKSSKLGLEEEEFICELMEEVVYRVLDKKGINRLYQAAKKVLVVPWD